MTQFVLIDQSLTDYGGHHYEYAQRVLSAASEAGYETVLATNRKFRAGDVETSRVFPVYQHGYWYRFQQPRPLLAARSAMTMIRHLAFRGTFWALFSPLGLTWTNRREMGEYWGRSWSLMEPRQRAFLLPLLIVAAGLKFALRAAGAVAQFALAVVPFKNWLAEGARAAKHLCREASRTALRLARCPVPLRLLLIGSRKARCFERDTLSLLNEMAVTSGDVFFIPNIEENEMLGLLQVLRGHPKAASASWHLLFRRNIYVGRSSQYLKQDEGLRQLRNQFRYFVEQTDGARVFFYTDTEQLSEQYGRLGVGLFQSLPIPVGSDYRPAGQQEAGPCCANITYVGDAREEKGYHHLPRLVQDLWRDYIEPGRARCTFQSNYNTDSGEPHAVVSRSQLAQYPSDKVRLLLEPLGPTNYRDLIVGADVAVLPYDRDNYYARSSGVFAETIAAGVPVVVPAGSWMALQFARFVSAHHGRLLRDKTIDRQVIKGSEASWRLPGRKGKFDLADGALQLGGESAHHCLLPVPERASYVLIHFRQECDHEGEFVRIEIQTRIPGSRGYVTRRHAVVGGVANEVASALICLPDDERIRVVFRNAFGQCAQTLSDIELHFLRPARPLPLSAAGMTYDDPNRFSRAVREVLDHLDHYKQTAAELSTTWATYHHPSTLIGKLTERLPVDAERPWQAVQGDALQTMDSFSLRKAS
ncbi:MAG TPA: hypothetical protein VG125_15120 [Pirellulales bacterium]|jgi:hypothetical protein|nr:hypothetical protein [Pirellulales bacterium]